MENHHQPQLPPEHGVNYGSLVETGNATATSNVNAKVPESRQAQSHKWTLGAGILYAVIIFCGIVSEVGLRESLIDYDDTATTSANIQD